MRGVVKRRVVVIASTLEVVSCCRSPRCGQIEQLYVDTANDVPLGREGLSIAGLFWSTTRRAPSSVLVLRR